MRAYVQRSSLHGETWIPGSKSHMIRALYFASLANGTSTIRKPVRSQDALSALGVCAALGVPVDTQDDEMWVVQGGSLHEPENVIDVGNSGTSMCLGAGIIASIEGAAVVTGDDQIRRRPAQPVLDALRPLGAEAFTIRNNGSAPFYLRGPLRGGKTLVDGIISQYISATLIAASLSQSDCEIVANRPNEKPYIEMTLQWMRSLGVDVQVEGDYRRFYVRAGQPYRPFDRYVPADFSSAAFPLAAAAITDSDLVLRGLDTTDVQGDKVLIDILREMGADIEVLENGSAGIRVRGGRRLRGITIDCSSTPDSVPILAVLGCVAEGTTRLVGIASSRLKETDRPLEMQRELTKLGARVELTDTALIIHQSALSGAPVASHRDHRIAMALTVAGMIAEGETVVDQVESAAISYPGFDREFAAAGARVTFREE